MNKVALLIKWRPVWFEERGRFSTFLIDICHRPSVLLPIAFTLFPIVETETARGTIKVRARCSESRAERSLQFRNSFRRIWAAIVVGYCNYMIVASDSLSPHTYTTLQAYKVIFISISSLIDSTLEYRIAIFANTNDFVIEARTRPRSLCGIPDRHDLHRVLVSTSMWSHIYAGIEILGGLLVYLILWHICFICTSKNAAKCNLRLLWLYVELI